MRLLGVLGVMILTLSVAGVALAGVPSQATSTVERVGQGTPGCNPDKAIVCPFGDLGSVLVTVTVRNVYGDPLPGKTVNCQAIPVNGTFCFCPGQTPQSGVTDLNGQVFFTFFKFGGCGDLQFGADCDAVVFNPSATIYIAGPDRDGNCSVNSIDYSMFGQAYGTATACFDFNCDGAVNSIDFSIFGQHYGHICP